MTTKNLKGRNPSEFDKKRKEDFSKAVVLQLIKWEKILRKEAIKQFDRQEEETLASVKTKAFTVDFNVREETDIFIDAFNPIIREIIKIHGEQALELLSDNTFRVRSRDIEEFLKGDGLKFCNEVNVTTKNELAKTIAEGTTEGESINEIRDRVGGIFTRAKQTRSVAIARSEASRSANFGIVEGYRQSNVVMAKEWVTALDERTCPYCFALDGKIVGLDESYFEEGDKFDPPGAERPLDIDYGDVDQPPVHTNCRCTTIPILIK